MTAPNFENMLHEAPYSVRNISADWVEQRAKELGGDGEPDIEGALGEAYEQLCTRIRENQDHEREAIMYLPSHPGAPYVIMIPVLNVSASKKFSAQTPVRNPVPNPDTRQSNIRLDFENVVLEVKLGITANDLARDAAGRYINPLTEHVWEGFRLYHNKLTLANSKTFKDKYNKSLGRYVLAKVNAAGGSLFTQAPFRHLTLAQALAEASRLAYELQEGFAVYRCIDIVGKPQEVIHK